MVTKYFRFNMSDDNEDTYWGYATGSGEYSSETVSLDKIPYDEATGIIRSWLKNCGAITNTLEIDNAVARAFSKGSTSAVSHYDNGEKYRMTIETDNREVFCVPFKINPEQTEQTRRALLEASFALFARKSIEPVTMEEAAKAAGFGVATMYRYYSTKPKLVIAVATYAFKRLSDEYIRRVYDGAVEQQSVLNLKTSQTKYEGCDYR